MSRFTTSTLSPGITPEPVRPPLLAEPPDPIRTEWTCPVTGLLVPKSLEANLRWRQSILSQAAYSESLQGELKSACRTSLLFWLNAFVWTFRQKVVGEDGEERPVTGEEAHYPFLTWPVQDEFAVELEKAIEDGHDVGIIKSRDMGASWLCIAVLHHQWQFRRNASFQEMSRKEELVDRRGNMDTLFEKHRYINRMQPEWLRPRVVKDRYMHLENVDLGSVIVGESTNVHAGQGGRKTAILLDEFGRVANAEEIELATADTTACRIFNSTPSGPGTGFHQLITQRRELKVLRMPWWRHPEKARGAHQIINDKGKIVWTSPWYEKERPRRSKRDMAQNLDMEFGKAGDQFFDADELERHRMDHSRTPVLSGVLDYRQGRFAPDQARRTIRRRDASRVAFVPGKGPWKLWTPLSEGRLVQQHQYLLAADISNGAGESNSVIVVVDVHLKEVVAEYASPFVSPDELAVEMLAAGAWVGGTTEFPLFLWENNGPGGIFGRRIVKSGWPSYFRNKVVEIVHERRTSRYGWHSSTPKKVLLIGALRDAMCRDEIICHGAEFFTEAADYIWNDDGTLIPGRLRKEKSGARATHGDRVIAYALGKLGLDEVPKIDSKAKVPPPGTFAHRRELALAARKRDDAWRL